MRKSTLLALALLLLAFTAEAKVGKIKYGKYIIYEGEIENNTPHGQGTLTVTRITDKNTVYASINGIFDNNQITNSMMDASDFCQLGFEGDMTFEPKGEKGKAMEIAFNFTNGTLYHDDIEYMGRPLKRISIHDLQINMSTDMESKEWTFSFGPHSASNIKFDAYIQNMPLPYNVDLFGYSSQKMIGLNAEFTINNVLVECRKEGKYVFNDGSYYRNSIMHFSNNDEVVLNNNDWTGTMTYADGTHIQKDAKDHFVIAFKNGNRYEGTLKRTSLQDLARRGSDHPDFKYNSGVLTTNGVSEKWISGEPFSKRHQRLTELMRPELVAEVENESMTEQDAIAREKELKAEEERQLKLMAAKRLEFSDDSISAVNEQSSSILGLIKGKRFSGIVTKNTPQGTNLAKKVQLQLSVYFVSLTRCILSFNGKVLTPDMESYDYYEELMPEFVEDGNFAYRVEDGQICLYETNNYERIPYTFTITSTVLNCEEFAGQLKIKK